jgi:uncharacterized protein (TIGR02284 family)
MATSEEKLITHLNQLLSLCQDGRYGFETAAKHAKSKDLQTLFYSISVDREQFANALKHEIRKREGDPHKGGDTLGALHRVWIDVKTALSSEDDKVILEACMTGERAAVKAYKEVLEKALIPADTRNIISIQHVRIEESIKKIEEFWESFK